MLNTIRNVDLVIASIPILLVLYISGARRFMPVSKSNHIFYDTVLCAISACVADIALNVAISYPGTFSVFSFKILRIIFSILVGLTTFMMYFYYKSYQIPKNEADNKKSRFGGILVFLIMVFYILISVANIWYPTVYIYGEDGSVLDGPLHFTIFLIPAIMCFSACVLSFVSRNDFTKRQFYSIYVYTALGAGFMLAEAFVGSRILFSMFGISLALVYAQTTLTTPENAELQKSIAEKEEALEESNRAFENAEEMRKEAENARLATETAYLEAQASKQEALAATAEAEKSREEAVAANKAKSAFLARMSHEIRTPMNAIIGVDQMIVDESSEQFIRDYASDAQKAGENLLNIINDILDFSKIESGKLELLEDDYSFKDVISEEYALFLFKTKEKGLKLEFDIDENIPSVLHGDYVRIRQILTNLLSNAVKYTDNGKVTLKVSLEGKGRSSVLLKFVVKDTGRGIKDEDIGKLYDAFERIEEKRNRSIEGTGLGVNICVQLLTLMGSKLMVDSVYGLGSQFSFSLRQTIVDPKPIGAFEDKENTEDKPVEIKVNECIKASKAHVLVVDDNSMNLKVFSGLLKKTGINIDEASGGAKAIELSKENKYDIIFMDHLMPDIDGVEALNEIRKDETSLNRDSVIIALTANAIKGAHEEYLGYGFNDVVFKPAKFDELNSVLWKYIPGELIEN